MLFTKEALCECEVQEDLLESDATLEDEEQQGFESVEDDFESDAAAARATVSKKGSANILSVYLHEISKRPILTRGQEQVLAKKFAEAEHTKHQLAEQWLLFISRALDWHKLKAARKNQPGGRVTGLGMLIKNLKTVRELYKDIRGIERTISKPTISYYLKRKLLRQKAESFIALQERVARTDVISLYRRGTIKKLRPYEKRSQTRTERRRLIGILRDYLSAYKISKQAKDELVKSNLRLVVGIAKKYINPHKGLYLADLIQEGNLGLLRAIEKFDYRLGNRLSTYASWWIRQTIIRSIEDKASTIRVPVYINGKLKKFLKDAHQKDTDTAEPTDDTLEGETGMLYNMLQSIKDPLSLEASFGEDGSTLHECIPDMIPASPLEEVLRSHLIQETEGALKDLLPREERILRLRFGLGVDAEHTLEEIGEEFGISRERIRQIETMALRKIKASQHIDVLRLFLGN